MLQNLPTLPISKALMHFALDSNKEKSGYLVTCSPTSCYDSRHKPIFELHLNILYFSIGSKVFSLDCLHLTIRDSIMPIQLEEGRESLVRAGEDVRRRVHHSWDGFIDFAFSDNVLEVAIGLMYDNI